MIYQRGKNKTWWMRFRFGGRFIHESTRTNSKTVARDAERHRRRELEKKWNRIEKRILPPTLTQATKRWIEKRASLASNTLETYQAALKHVRALLGSMLVCEIEARDIVGYQKCRLAKGAAGAAVQQRNLLSQFNFGRLRCLGTGPTRCKKNARE
jgi:hypothetical protein